MFKKFAAILLTTTAICSTGYANLLDTPEWGKALGSESYYMVYKGIERTGKKPRIATLMQGFYYSQPKSDETAGVSGISYFVFTDKYIEGKKDVHYLDNMVYYDSNGDVILGFHESEMKITPQNDMYNRFIVDEQTKLRITQGTESKTFFLSPFRWYCVGGSQNVSFFIDKQSLRYYEQFGEKKVDIWSCIANSKNKTYFMSKDTYNLTTRSYKSYDAIIYSYGDHVVVESGSLYGKESSVIPGTATETIIKTLEKLR